MARLRRGSPELIRDLNRAAILGLIGERGPIARVDIARHLRLSAATVTDQTRALVDEGLVQVVDQAPSGGGRPRLLLGIVGAAAQALGVKIAPDHLAIVHVNLDGELLGGVERPFDATAPDAAQQIVRELETALATVARDARLLGIGLGVPGIVDPLRGIVDAPGLGWRRVPLGEILRARLHLPILIDNDVNTLAVAERLYGRGRGVENFITVTIGRGVGLGIVVGGDLYRGFRGGAGEFGHLPVVEGGPLCDCGRRGCLEALIGDRALVEQAIEAAILPPDARMPEAVQRLRDAAAAGDERALAIYDAAGRHLGRAVAGLVNVLSPEVVLIGGEGTAVWPHFATGFDEGLRGAVFGPLADIAVEVDPWDDAKWARGAAALVLRATFATPLYERQLEDSVRDRLTEPRADGRARSTRMDADAAAVLAIGARG